MTKQTFVERAAYADIVAGLADARPDSATERFDAEIAAAVADGRIDQNLGRTLRWWQRESLRGLRDHLVEVLPPVLASLDVSALRALGAPERASSADNHDEATAKSAPVRSVPVTVGSAVSSQRRRILVASLVAATSPKVGARFEGKEGRR